MSQDVPECSRRETMIGQTGVVPPEKAKENWKHHLFGRETSANCGGLSVCFAQFKTALSISARAER